MPRAKGFRGRPGDRSGRATPLGEVVEGLMRDRAFAPGVPIGQLAAGWAEVVGPRLSAESAPVSLERGLLLVAATTGPWGAQVRFLADQIRARANATLGGEQVRQVRVVVRDAPGNPWGARRSSAHGSGGSPSGTPPDVTPD